MVNSNYAATMNDQGHTSYLKLSKGDAAPQSTIFCPSGSIQDRVITRGYHISLSVGGFNGKKASNRQTEVSTAT
jgi:hypothetical protein